MRKACQLLRFLIFLVQTHGRILAVMGNEGPEGAWLSASTGKLFVNGQSHLMRTCAELENLPNDENENKATYGSI